MQANLTASNGQTQFPELPENCFYFVDNPRAIAARSGIRAKVANARRKRERNRRLDRKGVPLSRSERLANLQWFYASASAEDSELSPFDSE